MILGGRHTDNDFLGILKFMHSLSLEENSIRILHYGAITRLVEARADVSVSANIDADR